MPVMASLCLVLVSRRVVSVSSSALQNLANQIVVCSCMRVESVRLGN